MTETATAPELRHITLPLAPGAKVTVWIPDGHDLTSPLPALGRGFTIDLSGDRWRATVETLSKKRNGTVVDLTIEGRYEETGAMTEEEAAERCRTCAFPSTCSEFGRCALENLPSTGTVTQHPAPGSAEGAA